MLSSAQDACKILAGSAVFVLVHIVHVISVRIEEHLAGNHVNYKPEPFLKTYIRSSVFVIFLIGLVFKIPWKSFFEQLRRKKENGDAAYSALAQSEEIENEEQEITEEHQLGESKWVPINGPNSETGSTDMSNDEGDEDKSDAKKVTFDEMAEIKTLPLAEAEQALYSRLSFTAAQKYETDLRKKSMRMSPLATLKLAFKLSFIWFFANYFHELSLIYQPTYFLAVTAGMTVTFSFLFMIIECTSRISTVFSSEPKFSITQVLAVLIGLSGLVVVFVTSLPKIELSYIQPGIFWAFSAAMLYSCFIIILRKEVDHDERLDIPLFLGLIGFCNMITLWPGLLWSRPLSLFVPGIPSSSPVTTSTNTLLTFNQMGFIVCLELFTSAFVEVAWIWSCLVTSVLISSTSFLLTIPIVVAMDSNSLLTPFWIGSACLIVSFVTLVISTSWNLCFTTSKLVSNSICERSKASLTSLRPESLFSQKT